MVRKMLKIIGILFGVAVIILIAVAVVFCYQNTHWWEKDMKAIEKLGIQEKQITLPNGNTINYGELAGDGPALLLIHGQMVAWEEYASVIPDLSKNWHVYAVDLYGHGESSHEEELYYLDVNGDDLIWFIDNVIGEDTVVSGHSNGALIAAYIAAYGSNLVKGVVLEDPPVFSTQGENWETSFAYLDTYQPLHEYISSEQTECWPAYYLRHCYWGQLFMKDAMPGLANYAQKYREKHPTEEVKIMFLPSSITTVFHYVEQYDMLYGEHFYNLTWNNGITHEEMLSDIDIPCVYLHAKENVAETGVYLCAASKEQADRAVDYIGENCRLVETESSDHNIHGLHEDIYLDAVNSFLEERCDDCAE
ncbi:MAG: alpha/beta hydrolase [Clostridia bacterium]|nr:alpha/beta hydrolase [Clostridia bacterium]